MQVRDHRHRGLPALSLPARAPRPYTGADVILTKLWAAILAGLATVLLAGMFLLSLDRAGGFSQADRAALRAVTEAGLAALTAEIQASPVTRASTVLQNPRLKQTLEGPPPRRGQPEPDFNGLLNEIAETGVLSQHPKMTLALVDQAGSVIAKAGIADQLLGEVIALPAYQSLPPEQDSLFSATLGSSLHAVHVSAADASEQARRLVAIQALDVGAGSLLRRVLGRTTPSALVRDGKVLGDIFGDQPVGTELEVLSNTYFDATPDEGASEPFVVGEGLDARIGVLGRVPGPAGKGKHGTALVVLSHYTAAASRRDLAEALLEANDKGLAKQVNWPLLGGLLLVSLALAFYLPSLEATGPIRRLTDELKRVLQGSQRQIFYEGYPGMMAELARTTQAVIDAAQAPMVPNSQDMAQADGSGGKSVPVARIRLSGTRSHRRVGKTSSHASVSNTDPSTGTEHSTNTGTGTRTGTSNGTTAGQQRMDLPVEAGIENIETKPIDHVVGPAPIYAPEIEKNAILLATAEPIPAPPSGRVPSVDPKEEYFREIYDEFVQTKVTCGENIDGFTFEKFAVKLRRNTQELKQKPGVKDVEFTVYVKDGKAALKARVVKEGVA